MKFICPKCGGSLVITESGSARCHQNHSFDRAKEGYYNLLLSSVGGVHGDNREMVDSRRAFLSSGAYFPLACRVCDIASEYFFGGDALDIGCGEGYYTDIIEKTLSEKGISVSVSGFDISKDAVKRAAKRNPRLSLAVASAYRIPLADETFDLAFNMFSPLALSETHRVLKKGGIFIMAIPAEEHLFELKKEAYKTPYKNEVADSELQGFELLKTSGLTYKMNLKTNAEVRSLFMMTPYAYRTKPEDKARVTALDSLEVTADFIVFAYKKKD